MHVHAMFVSPAVSCQACEQASARRDHHVVMPTCDPLQVSGACAGPGRRLPPDLLGSQPIHQSLNAGQVPAPTLRGRHALSV